MILPDRGLPRASKGFSLVETLMVIVLLGMSVYPVYAVMQSTNSNVKSGSLQTSRTLVMNRIINEIEPDDPTFSSDCDDAALSTVAMADGSSISYLRKVDTTNSNALKRRIYYYVYANSTDPLNAPIFKGTHEYTLPELRIDVGNTTGGYADSALQTWTKDVAYDGTNKVPGYLSAGITNPTSPMPTAPNNTADPLLFQTYREASTLSYNFDVENGEYMVQLYVAEMDNTVTNSAPNRRSFDVSLEGKNVLSNYSPFAKFGYQKAQVLTFNTTVSDGVLNLQVSKNGSNSDKDPQLSGIVLKRRSW